MDGTCGYISHMRVVDSRACHVQTLLSSKWIAMNLVDFKFLFQERNPALRQPKRSGWSQNSP